MSSTPAVPPPQEQYHEETTTTTIPQDFDIDDIVQGMKYASLSITDDNEDTLAKVGRMNPWHIEALTLITGSAEEAHQPLSHILEEHMGLTLDCHIDRRGITKGMHFLDTQGYIAHNDDVIVLAYRCTTSIFDWLTNFNASSSAWELEKDIALGYSGRCSGLEGLCCRSSGAFKPRVHTGFYNNFLATVVDIQKYVEPLLLDETQPPRKLFVCGHSLGAGVATMAACYFLLEYDWTRLKHSMVVVTAGSPRACQNSMREHVQDKMKELEEKGFGHKICICRVVNDKDIVPTLPPAMLGYRHIDDLVFISQSGNIRLVGEGQETKSDKDQVNAALKKTPKVFTAPSPQGQEHPAEEEESSLTDYDKKVQNIPRPLRDHMPDFYLKPMLRMASSVKNMKTAKDEDIEVGL